MVSPVLVLFWVAGSLELVILCPIAGRVGIGVSLILFELSMVLCHELRSFATP